MFLSRTFVPDAGSILMVTGAAMSIWGFTRATPAGYLVGALGFIPLFYGQYLSAESSTFRRAASARGSRQATPSRSSFRRRVV
jgi:hypothetical protein